VEPQPKSNLVHFRLKILQHFRLKILQLVQATILNDFAENEVTKFRGFPSSWMF